MVTRTALEKRLSELEAKTKPKTIKTLADLVLWMANKRPGDPIPPMDPYFEETWNNCTKNAEV